MKFGEDIKRIRRKRHHRSVECDSRQPNERHNDEFFHFEKCFNTKHSCGIGFYTYGARAKSRCVLSQHLRQHV